MIVYVNRYKHPLIPSRQGGMDTHTPWEAENMDYIYEQILYRNRLLLEANGESCQVWRKLTEANGTRCDNPNCAAYDNLRQEGNADCPRCMGTSWIGGWSYQNETLVRIVPSGLQFTITQEGLMKVHNPRSWTFPEPAIKTFDILIAFDRPQIVQERMLTDEKRMRRIDLHANFDSLSDAGATKILKISDGANQAADYKEKVDYELSNGGVLWRTTHRPSDMAFYYVTYQAAKSHYRRFEAANVTTPHWRGVPLHQEMELAELDVTHPAYRIPMREPDWTRRDYPFPVSDWVDRLY